MARHSTMATSAQAKTKRLWYLATICSGTGLINVLLMRLDCRASHHENRVTSLPDHFPHTATVPVKTAISLSTPSPPRQHRQLAALSSPHTSRGEIPEFVKPWRHLGSARFALHVLLFRVHASSIRVPPFPRRYPHCLALQVTQFTLREGLVPT